MESTSATACDTNTVAQNNAPPRYTTLPLICSLSPVRTQCHQILFVISLVNVLSSSCNLPWALFYTYCQWRTNTCDKPSVETLVDAYTLALQNDATLATHLGKCVAKCTCNGVMQWVWNYVPERYDPLRCETVYCGAKLRFSTNTLFHSKVTLAPRGAPHSTCSAGHSCVVSTKACDCKVMLYNAKSCDNGCDTHIASETANYCGKLVDIAIF